VDGNVAIAPWPEDDGNPYQRLFYEALSPFGFRRHSGLVINDQYLRDHAAQIDAVHLHWPEYAWRVHGTRLDRQARLVIGLARFLRLAGRLGIARVWTAHNVSPHEANSWLDHIGYFVVARSADVIITHGAIARRDVLTRYRPRCPVVVMPHANYQQAYPAPRGAAEVRVFSVRRRPAPVHRRVVRVDGADPPCLDHLAALPPPPRAGTSRRPAAAHHLAREARHADDRRAANGLVNW